MMLHEGQGYEGIDDTHRRARYFVSGLVLVGKLRACLKNATNVSYDFVQKFPGFTPTRPWENLVIDLCNLNGKEWFIIFGFGLFVFTGRRKKFSYWICNKIIKMSPETLSIET